jgi:hypothetical protein
MGQLNAYKRRNTAVYQYTDLNVGMDKIAENTFIQHLDALAVDLNNTNIDLTTSPNNLSQYNSNMTEVEMLEPVLPKIDTFLLICQIKAFDEAKLNKFVSNQSDMIVDFDFYKSQDKFNILSWSRDQHLRIHSMDLNEIAPKPKGDEDVLTMMPITNLTTRHIQQSATPNSSRKSSFSEINYGTPPAIELPSVKPFIEENLPEEIMTRTSVSISIPHTMLRSNHDFLKKHPKCFGAKFTNLPEQFLIFTNDGYDHNLMQNNKPSK